MLTGCEQEKEGDGPKKSGGIFQLQFPVQLSSWTEGEGSAVSFP